MKAAEVVSTSTDRAVLRWWLTGGKTEQRLALRARVILGVAEGLRNAAVAMRVGIRPATVSKWRGRFARAGLAGLRDATRSGKPAHYEAAHERRILAALDDPPPAGYGRWDGALLARQLGDISKHHIWRVLRQYPDQLGPTAQLVHQHRPVFCAEGGRCRRALSAAAGECSGVGG